PALRSDLPDRRGHARHAVAAPDREVGMTPEEYRRIMGMADASAMARGAGDLPDVQMPGGPGLGAPEPGLPDMSSPVRMSVYDALEANQNAGQGPGLGAMPASQDLSIDQL